MRVISTVFDFCVTAVATAAFLGVIIAVILQVFFRYVLQQPLAWSEEAARLLAVWMTFIGGAVVIRRGGHLRIEILFDRFSRDVRIYLHSAFTVLMIFMLLIVAYGGWLMADMSRPVSMASMRWLSTFWLYIPATIGSLLMIINLLRSLRSPPEPATLAAASKPSDDGKG